jgi:hypothetical protein
LNKSISFKQIHQTPWNKHQIPPKTKIRPPQRLLPPKNEPELALGQVLPRPVDRAATKSLDLSKKSPKSKKAAQRQLYLPPKGKHRRHSTKQSTAHLRKQKVSLQCRANRTINQRTKENNSWSWRASTTISSQNQILEPKNQKAPPRTPLVPKALLQ